MKASKVDEKYSYDLEVILSLSTAHWDDLL
jgi:hypothetical protein